MTELATITESKDFRTALKEKVLGALVELIPEEEFNNMLNAEVKAFFESEQLLVIEQGKVQIDNPRYNPSNGYQYGNDKTITKDCMVLNIKMTPFRQLVWKYLSEYVSNQVSDVINSEHSAVKQELDKWFVEVATDDINETQRALINKFVMTGSMGIINSTISTANSLAKATMISALQQAGVDVSKVHV